ncbi:MAG: hypothetical protein ABW217_06960 [Polyangiaceae bacterium]
MLLASGVLALLVLCTREASAYPYFVGLRAVNCSECHYSPTGGGLINEWGRSSRGVTFGGTDDWSLHSDAKGHDQKGAPALQLDFGADARAALVLAGPSVAFFPMLLELQGVAAYGPVEAYIGITPRKGSPGGSPYLLFSREHWLMLRLASQVSVRAGRLVLPFGIRNPDHTQYVREDFGFDKWDQSYALELDISSDDYTLAAAAFAGDLTWEAADVQERGGVVRGTLNLSDDRGFVGAAVLGSHSVARDRIAGSVFTGLRPLDHGYVLAEVAAQRLVAGRTDSTLTTWASYVRLGWFLTDAVDVYTEEGYRLSIDHSELAKWRAALGSNWQVWSWFELVPQVMVEHLNGRGSELVAMAQIHLLH